ncbi:MAG: sensor histidine kinase [Ardenticatenaceae bacterium]|nr:sensor histidine kinase [Ardenticatenaceae bacterium]MCB8948617.1 sensor histidine kinase [Ardenticatenaceae bacterium]
MVARRQFTLAQRYMFVSLVVMLAGMVGLGLWISQQIETAVTNRTAAVTALYVDSYISPHLQGLAEDENSTNVNVDALERLLTDTSLGTQIVSFKVWSPDGVVLYATNSELIGQQFPLEEGLAEAFNGEVVTEVSDLDKPEQALERAQFGTLIETYAPSRDAGSDTIIAVSEFYQTSEGLEAEIRTAQYRSWLVVAAVMIVVYVLLAGIVGRASNTIVSQQDELKANVTRLNELLQQNEILNGRVRRAAARSTALNEKNLRRISADLHDGPAQDLALALLRLESLSEAMAGAKPEVSRDFSTIHLATESAMEELRTISAGLRLPEIAPIRLTETIQRAVHDFEKKTQCAVTLTLGNLPEDAPLPVKITAYRVLKESLANSFRHAEGKGLTVHAYTNTNEQEELVLEITDSGPGFDPESPAVYKRLGLVGMRERVELLGGRFELHSAPGHGTTIRALLPLTIPEVEDV